MKKTKKATLLLLALVSALAMVSVGSVAVASADEGDTDPAAEDELSLYGRGWLKAEGDGIAVLGGRGVVDIEGNGILWVRDFSGNATIRVTGHGEKEEFPDGWIQYAGFHGTAHLAGTRLVVVLAGSGVELEARGIGRALLWGHGTYSRGNQVDEESGEWSLRFTRWLRFGPARTAVTPAEAPDIMSAA